MIKFNTTAVMLSALVLMLSCENSDVKAPTPVDDSPIFVDLAVSSARGRLPGQNFALYMGEYITTGESGQAGRTIYFNNVGNKQLTADFVPGLSLDGSDNVSYYVDQNRPSADLAVAVSSAAIDRAMTTWDNVTCSELGLTKVPSDNDVTTGFVAALVGMGGSTDYVADVTHSGWLPAAFFNAIAPPNGSTYILGVTFTIIFTDEDGNPVDTDNNGAIDVAWREIYYNDAFTWKDGATYDVETIALHEAGHGLSQGHFGKAFADAGAGKLHFSPRAVMNAAYSGIQRQIGQTDNAGHCSNWAAWPEN
jgi:hypothetical protein